VQRFRGGLVFKRRLNHSTHRLLYHSTLGLRVIKKKKGRALPGRPPPALWHASPRMRPRAPPPEQHTSHVHFTRCAPGRVRLVHTSCPFCTRKRESHPGFCCTWPTSSCTLVRISANAPSRAATNDASAARSFATASACAGFRFQSVLGEKNKFEKNPKVEKSRIGTCVLAAASAARRRAARSCLCFDANSATMHSSASMPRIGFRFGVLVQGSGLGGEGFWARVGEFGGWGYGIWV